MSALREATVLDEYDRPVPGAIVYVTNSAGFNAVLASDAGGMALLAQPVTTDEFGVYRYYAADGFYREDIWYGGRLRYSQAGVPVGDTVGLLPEAVFRSEAARDGAEAAEASVLASLNGAAFSSLILSAADRTVLAALDHSTGLPAILTETYRGGTFKWIGTNLSAMIAIDPQQGVYVPPLSDATGASGAWVRQYEGALNVKWFGASGDDIMDDSTAFLATNAFSYASAQDGTGFGKAGPSIFAPFGKYYLAAQTLDFKHSIDFFGEGSVGTSGGAATQLRWDDDVTGIRMQSSDTTGDTGTGAQSWPGAAGSRIRNFYLKGGYAGVESEHHGILMRVKTQIDNVFIDNFPGDGLAVISGVGGNNNGWCVNRLFVRRCRDGLRVDGPNSQVGLVTNLDLSQNRRWSGWESSQIGNTYQGVCENNGVTVGATPTLVSYGGHIYAVIVDQEAGAATNPPSGDTTDNTWWYYCYDAGPDPARPAWFNGIVVRAGGAFRTSNVNGLNLFPNWYSENGQGPMQLSSPSLVLGGYRGAGVKGSGASIQANNFGVLIPLLQVLKQLVLGDSASPVVADTTMFMDSVGGSNSIIARQWAGGVPVVTNTLLFDANGTSCMGAFNIFSAPGPALVVSADDTGILLNVGKVLKVGGTKVVGTQQAAISNAVNAAAAPTMAEFNALVLQFNTHLQSDRNHGLIAT